MPSAAINLKQRLRAQEATLGSWITLAHPTIAEIFCRAGYDWLTVDLEHSTITLAQAEELIRTIDGFGSVPLVRLSGIDAVQIKRVLDSGAKGIIVPNVKDRTDVDRVVSYMCYPPKGERGVGLARAQHYGPNFKDYMTNFDSQKVLVTQIENVNAIQNIDEILSHPDVDAYILGPYDLSSSLGVPGEFDHPLMLDALAKVKASALRHNKVGGIHVISPDPAELASRRAEGYKFIAFSLDIRMLDVAARAGSAQA